MLLRSNFMKSYFYASYYDLWVQAGFCFWLFVCLFVYCFGGLFLKSWSPISTIIMLSESSMLYKCTVTENTNKSAYCSTSHKSNCLVQVCVKTWVTSKSSLWLAQVSLESSIIWNREHLGVATHFRPMMMKLGVKFP